MSKKSSTTEKEFKKLLLAKSLCAGITMNYTRKNRNMGFVNAFAKKG